MSEPRGSANASVNQWVINSYFEYSTLIGHAEHVHASADRVPSVDALANLNLQRAAELLRECLGRPEQVRTAIDRLALVPPDRAVHLLCQLDPRDHRLWGAVLLYMGRQRCRPFVDAMTREQQAQTVRSAIEHLRRRCHNGRAADAAATLLDTDRQVAATLLAKMPPGDCARILAASGAADRVSLLNDMVPKSVYQLVTSAGERSSPTVHGWLGAMRPDRVAAALTSTKPQQQVAVTAVRVLNAAQGPAATAEMLVAARLPGAWADALLRALSPVAAAEVLEHGRKHGRTWVRLLGPDLLARIALAVDAGRTADLLRHAARGQLASTLPKLPPHVAIGILADLEGSAVADCLGTLAPKHAARLLGLAVWRVRLNVAFGAVHMGRSHKVRATLGLVARADVLAQAPPDVISRVLAEMPPTTAAGLLAQMSVNRVQQIIAIALDQAPAWLSAMPPDAAINILSALDSRRAADMLAALPSSRAVRLLAMTRAETLLFEADRLRNALERAAAAARDRQSRQLLEAQGQALRRARRLLAAWRIGEAEPMAVLMRPAAVSLWRELDPQVLERLRADMSHLAVRRLLGGTGNR